MTGLFIISVVVWAVMLGSFLCSLVCLPNAIAAPANDLDD